MLILIQRVFTLLLPFLWKDRKNIIATITTLGIILGSTAAHTASPWLFGYLLKHYHTLPTVALCCTVLLLIFCWSARISLNDLRSIVFFRIVNRAIRDTRLRMVMQLHQVPLREWKQYGVTEIVSASTRVSSSIRRFMSITFVNILPSLFKILTFSIAMVHSHRFTWYFPPLVLLTYGYVYIGLRRFLQSRRHLWEATDQVNTAMDDSLHNTKFSRFHLQAEEQRLGDFFDKEAQEWLYNNFHQYKIPLVQATLFSISMAILTTHMVLLLRAGQLTVPDFVVIKGYIFAIYGQMYRITARLRSLLSSVIDLKKVLDLLALPRYQTDAALPGHEASLDFLQPILQARNVSFGHEHGAPILQDLSLTVHKGDKIAITGSSGIGKSTLCHLLAGIYQPSQGEVLLYGTPIRQLSLATIGRYVHFVDQEANIVSGTIADNLMTHAPEVQVAPLGSLKSRLHHTAGDAGKRLSGGEKQRIFLARCLSYQPEVLILDETLSALDEGSAQELLQLVLRAVPTVILVTHRKSLTQSFKHTYQLEAGQLAKVEPSR